MAVKPGTGKAKDISHLYIIKLLEWLVIVELAKAHGTDIAVKKFNDLKEEIITGAKK